MSNLRELTRDFTNDDYMVVVAGTSDIPDMAKENCLVLDLELLTIAKKTNLIVPGIPLRFHKPIINNHINEV